MKNPEIRQWFRRIYLRQHAQQRRATAKDAGAKRIDVTLHGDALDDYGRVKEWLDEINRLGIERGFFNKPLTGHDGTTITVPPHRLSATEVIRSALSLAVSKIEDDNKGR